MTRRVTVRAKRPSFQRERTLGGRVAGVDEAGRGPLAGPVVAAAVIFGSAMVQRGLPRALMPLIDDSKKLSAQDREAALVALRQLPGTEIGIGAASVGEIGQLNILHATMLAMRRAVARLREPPEAALFDGDRIPAGMICPAESVVGGDALCLSIAAASIVAKVVRDRAMARLAVRHHGYGWERNAGYATLAHRDALHLFGPTRHHRATFGTVRQLSLDLGLIAPCVLVPG